MPPDTPPASHWGSRSVASRLSMRRARDCGTGGNRGQTGGPSSTPMGWIGRKSGSYWLRSHRPSAGGCRGSRHPSKAPVLDGQLLVMGEAIAGRQPALVVRASLTQCGRPPLRCVCPALADGRWSRVGSGASPRLGDAARHRPGRIGCTVGAGEGGRAALGKGSHAGALCLHHATEVARNGYLCRQAIRQVPLSPCVALATSLHADHDGFRHWRGRAWELCSQAA